MDLRKLAETVLLQLECFWVLQELDHASDSGDRLVSEFLDTLYAGRSVSWRSLQPLVRLNTVLALLVVPISFAARLSDQDLLELGFSVSSEHQVRCRENGRDRSLSPREVLLVLRNAVAHLPDFAAGDTRDVNVSFGEGVLRCWTQTKSREIIFQTEAGFVVFLRDLVGLCRKAAGKLVTAH